MTCASFEWRLMIECLMNFTKTEDSMQPPARRHARDIEFDRKRGLIIARMKENGGSITPGDAHLIYGGRKSAVYHAMDSMVEDRTIEIQRFKPRIWRLSKGICND